MKQIFRYRRIVMTEKKYKLSRKRKDGLRRIIALRDIPSLRISKGDLGGLLEGYDNLSQDEDAWVYKQARVYDQAHVSGQARVYGHARVYGLAWVHERARVYGQAEVFGQAQVSGHAQVYKQAQVSGHAQVYEQAQVYGRAQVFGDARVYGLAQVFGDARVLKEARVFGYVRLISGLWTRTPLQVIGGKFIVQVSSPTEISIGCQTHSVGWWRNEENWEEMRKDEGITDEEVAILRRHFEIAVKELEATHEI